MKVRYIETDHLDTPRSARNESRTVIWRWDYSAFGALLPNEDLDGDTGLTTINLRYPGQYFDGESMLHYNHHRFYASWMGRYLQSDPIGLGGGINTYAYALNNPSRYFDHDGQNPLLVPIAIGAVVGALADVGGSLWAGESPTLHGAAIGALSGGAAVAIAAEVVAGTVVAGTAKTIAAVIGETGINLGLHSIELAPVISPAEGAEAGGPNGNGPLPPFPGASSPRAVDPAIQKRVCEQNPNWPGCSTMVCN